MFPEVFLKRLEHQLGPAELAQFLAAAEHPRWVALRINKLKTHTPPSLDAFGLTPVPWADQGYYYDPNTRPGLSPYHEAGLYYLQEASAMAPAGLLDVHPGMRVLDLCAAPGGKSSQLAALLDGKGLLVSNEIEPKRAVILSRNLERMAVANSLVLNEHPRKVADRFEAYFDRILVDAPCSGEGMFRKEEAASTDWSVETVQMCAHRQGEILHSAAQMLRPGGRMVYSTCTFAPEENEGVISTFLQNHPDFTLVQVDAPWFSPGRPDWVDAPSCGLEHTFRLWPHHIHGEGHFAAVLERIGDGAAQDQPLESSFPFPKELSDFCSTAGISLPNGRLISLGKNLWMVPEEMPSLKGLKVLRAGLELGQLLKNRFEPAHALALWLKEAASQVDYSVDSPEIAAYLSGNTVAGSQTGWTLLKVDGLFLGWVKGSNGVLKNHFPKGLRRTLR